MRPIDADALMNSLNNMKVSGETFTTAVEFSQKIIENAPTVGGWISVKDRLPNDTKTKIVFHSRGVSFAYFSGMFWWSNIGKRHSLDTITHWMPLPEPPEEDKE